MKKFADKDIKNISILGSTGSIGTQTLDVVRSYPERFRVVALTAHSNWQLLAEQAREFKPDVVVISNPDYYGFLKDSLSGFDTGAGRIRVLCGEEGLIEAATLSNTDIVVGALVGFSGLSSVIAALEADKYVALANKETLVVAGEIINGIVVRRGKSILPVDSEHSAIFQCLWGERPEDVAKIILTASGGPFRNYDRSQLENVTVTQALSHPNWEMGTKVTIDSATMMNKGFEMIEARWLFNKSPEDIETVVHPESIVHSMVEFIDGSVKAQLGLPDMRLPIEVALAYPGRLDLRQKLSHPRLNLAHIGKLTFETPDTEKFPLLKLAYDVAAKGGLLPAAMNAANEVAVKAFVEKKIKFNDISSLVIKTVEILESALCHEEVTLSGIYKTHREGTEIALNLINNK